MGFHRRRRRKHEAEADAQADTVLSHINRNVLDWELSPQGLEPHVAKDPLVQRSARQTDKS